MRIAVVAPLMESVPPMRYGGTERVASFLTEELVRQGHEVTLFASGDSVTRALACRRAATRAGGVRTIDAGEARFNPMSYHNGSVWPHDNALIAMGCARYGCKREALRILVALCEAPAFLDLNRLPELYCGFVRRPGEGPTVYPVACAPQAWASAAAFYLLEACLGIGFEPGARRITLCQPMLPDFLNRLEVRNLQLADARVDLAFERHAEQVGVHVLAEEGGIEVAVLV